MPSKKSPSKTSPKTVGAKKVAPAATTTAAFAPATTTPATATPATMAPVEAAAAANQETFDTVLKAGTQAATKGYEQAIAIAQEQVEKASETLFKRYDEAASFGKDNVDACVTCSTVFAKGVESMSKELMSLAQSTVEANVATTKALFGAKSVRELIDLQTEFSRSRFDSLMAESAKLTELSMALANETIEPIQARMNATVEKLMKPIAA
jgi:phasin family protein